jgi:hypothetical protein
VKKQKEYDWGKVVIRRQKEEELRLRKEKEEARAREQEWASFRAERHDRIMENIIYH